MSEVEGELNHDEIDTAMQAAWEALEVGDVQKARAAAGEILAQWPVAAAEIAMLQAACDREEGHFESALARLAEAAKSDPEWATPELWMAEILSESPEGQTEALRHAKRAVDLAEEEDEFLGALGCKAAIEVELGRLAEARKTLNELPPSEVPLADPVVALEFVHLLIEAEAPTEARARLGVLTENHPTYADAWYLSGVLADMEGDADTRTTSWVKTRELDLAEIDAEAQGGDGHEHDHQDDSQADGHGHAEGHTHDEDCVHLTEAELAEVGEETLATIPEELRGRLAGIPILVVDIPAAVDVQGGTDPRALGLFHGATHAESGADPALTQIVLFRKNIERVAHDRESVRDEVRTTLLHEAGHFFGLDEAALERLGL
jgi:predicted Zn-dependent protease with MMP-like domain